MLPASGIRPSGMASRLGVPDGPTLVVSETNGSRILDFPVEVDGGLAAPRGSVAPDLGGPDRRTLYLVVDDPSHEGMPKGESTGWIRYARVDVPGAGSP